MNQFLICFMKMPQNTLQAAGMFNAVFKEWLIKDKVEYKTEQEKGGITGLGLFHMIAA